MSQKISYKEEKNILVFKTAAEVTMIQHFGYPVEGAHLYNDENEELVQGSRSKDDQTDHYIRNEKNSRSVVRGEVFIHLGRKKPKSFIYSQAFQRKYDFLLDLSDENSGPIPECQETKDYQQLFCVSLSSIIAEKLYLNQISSEDELNLAFYQDSKNDRVEQCLEKISAFCQYDETEKNGFLLQALNNTLKTLSEHWQTVEQVASSLLKNKML